MPGRLWIEQSVTDGEVGFVIFCLATRSVSLIGYEGALLAGASRAGALGITVLAAAPSTGGGKLQRAE